jgi:hypothetical protein
MTFLNAILAFGALAFTVPLVIHLLHRTQVKPIDWGAMHWLSNAVALKSRSVQWKQWLLLMLRCLIPVLLALAMSRPLVQSWLTTGAGQPISIAILLDDSASMQARNVIEGSRWNRALSELERISEKLPSGSSIAVVLAGGPPQLQSITDRASLSDWIAKWRTKPSVAGSVNIESSIRLAVEWLAKQTSPRRQILAISDFEANDWQPKPTWETAVNGLLDQQLIRPSFAWLQVCDSEQPNPAPGNTHSESENVFIEQLSVTPRHVFAGQDATIVIRIRNNSSKAIEKVRVRVDVSNNEIEVFEVSLQPNASLELQSRWKARRADDFLVHATVKYDDSMSVDNDAWYALSVSDPLPILLVDGERSSEAMKSETDFLKLALSPFAYLGSERADSFVCKVVSDNGWNEEMLKEYRAVALCNVSALTSEQQQSLRRYVDNGNAVVVFPGDRLSLDAWNRMPLVREGGLRPGVFSARAAVTSQASDEQSSGVHVETESLEWTVLSEMPRNSLESLRETQIKNYLPIEVDLADEKTTVAARFSNGNPWSIRSDLGSGSLIWFATSCDEEDSNLPSRAVYLPLMQRVFTEIVQRAYPQNLQPGQPWVWRASMRSFDAGNTPSKTFVFDTEGIEHSLLQERWDNTRQLGVYSAKKYRGEEKTTNYAVVSSRFTDQPSASDSLLKPADEESLIDLSSRLKATRFEDAKSFVDSTRQSWAGREIWSWFWIGAILCFLGEMLLEQSYLPRKSMSAADSSRTRRRVL